MGKEKYMGWNKSFEIKLSTGNYFMRERETERKERERERERERD